jgi:threonine/homoserine/homoserine lactone efflux protein
MLVVTFALTRDARAGVGASLGILAANAGYFVLSATSLGAVLVASWELFSLIKWLGAAYLIWLGLHMIVDAVRGSGSAASPAASSDGRLSPFTTGLLTQGANPKLLIFFTAILPQFIDPAAPVAVQVAILGVSSVIIELIVLCLYVAACRRARSWAGERRIAAPLQAIGGGLLMTAGVRLAALRRQ